MATIQTRGAARIRAAYFAGRIDGQAVTQKQVAKALGVSVRTVRQAINEGAIGAKSAKTVTGAKVNARQFPIAKLTRVLARPHVRRDVQDLGRRLRSEKGRELLKRIVSPEPDQQGVTRVKSPRFKSRVRELRRRGYTVTRRDEQLMAQGEGSVWQSVLSE